MSRGAALSLEEAVLRALASAKSAGATACDAIAAEHESSNAAVRLGEVETVKLSRGRRLGVRCFAGQASAVASTADLEAESVVRFAREVVEMARVVAPDPMSGLPPEERLARTLPDLRLADPSGQSLPPEERIERARRCEAAALACDPRLINSEGAEFSVSASRVVYASSLGFEGGYATTGYSLQVSPVASENGAMQRDYWWDSKRTLADLAEPEAIGRIAAERTLRRLGARPVPTQQVPVVFDPQTAASLAHHVAGAVCGGALYRRASFLLDKLGATVASPLLTVIDDGRMPGGLGSSPFDGEGVATQRTAVIERGVLSAYLLDSYSARKLGRETTGNAARSVGDVPLAAPTNLYVAAGASSPEEIIASVDRGLYVTSLSGFGVNGVTGDYSRGASGLWIENGKLAYPVEEITIAGNLLAMLRDIELVGDDLVFRSTVAAPTLKIRRMTVAGR